MCTRHPSQLHSSQHVSLAARWDTDNDATGAGLQALAKPLASSPHHAQYDSQRSHSPLGHILHPAQQPSLYQQVEVSELFTTLCCRKKAISRAGSVRPLVTLVESGTAEGRMYAMGTLRLLASLPDLQVIPCPRAMYITLNTSLFAD